jgi:hypothetical protein
MWSYKSPIGILYIICRNSRSCFVFDDERYGSYRSPNAAADDVARQVTECSEWDLGTFPQECIPSDLSHWQYH